MEDCNMVLVGRRATGKTTYLATLAHEFSRSNEHVQFSFQPSTDQARVLDGVYQQIGRGYTATRPSAVEDRWSFTCAYQSFYPLRLNYLDYSGEHEFKGTPSEPFVQSVREANILMGLVDGETVAACLRHKTVPRAVGSKEWRELSTDLDQLVAFLQEGKTSLPTHFVVSKWDLLGEDTNDRLGMVRDLLLRHDGLKQYCRERLANHIPLRIIPITTLGFDFFHRVWFRDVPRPNATPQPSYIEVPIAYALVDQVAMIRRQLEEDLSRQLVPSGGDTEYTRGEQMQLALAAGIEATIKKTPEIAGILVQLAVRYMANNPNNNRSYSQSVALDVAGKAAATAPAFLPKWARDKIDAVARQVRDRISSGPEQRHWQAREQLRRAMDDYERARQAKLDEAAAYQRIIANCEQYTGQWGNTRFPSSQLLATA